VHVQVAGLSPLAATVWVVTVHAAVAVAPLDAVPPTAEHAVPEQPPPVEAVSLYEVSPSVAGDSEPLQADAYVHVPDDGPDQPGDTLPQVYVYVQVGLATALSDALLSSVPSGHQAHS
jgi:hypothetical protein